MPHFDEDRVEKHDFASRPGETAFWFQGFIESLCYNPLFGCLAGKYELASHCTVFLQCFGEKYDDYTTQLYNSNKTQCSIFSKVL